MDSSCENPKILVPTYELPTDHGGIGRYIGALAQALPGILQIEKLTQNTPYRELVAQFRKTSAREIWVHHILPVGTAAWLNHLITGKPYVIFLHGLDFDLARTSGRKRLLARAILCDTRLVVTNSEALAGEVQTFAQRARVTTLCPCVDDVFTTTPHAPHQAGHTLRLLTVARLVERKGFVRVLEALVNLPDATYTIVGNGPFEETLRERIVHLGLENRVTVRTDVARSQELIALYDSHDVFVMPTMQTKTDREGFGIVYLEAAARGLPVVASQLPGVSEAVVDHETGFLVPDGDAGQLLVVLQMLRNNPHQRTTFGAAGKARVEQQFTQSAFARRAQHLLLPKVSVVIPVYNHANTIAQTLRALGAQTYPHIEIIVVNDGSTDATAATLEEYKRQTHAQELTVITQENRGAQQARNHGFAQATGEYVIFCDADVIMKSHMIERMVSTLVVHPEASFTYARFRFGWKLFRSQPFNPKTLKKLNYIHTTSLCRRADFPGFDIALRRFQDWDVWLTLAQQGKRGVFLKETLFRVIIDGPSRIGSAWLPACVYRIPWRAIGFVPRRVAKYEAARAIINRKHD